MAWRLLKQSISVVSLLAIVACLLGFAYVRATSSKVFSVQSGSMAPSIQKGDIVTVKSVPDYQVGDVITFINPVNKSQTITHRLVKKEVGNMNTTFVTQGDANTAPDAAISKNAILGKVNHTVPILGYGVDFVRKPLGLLLVIYLPAIGIIIGELKRLAAYYRKIKPYVSPEFASRLRTEKKHSVPPLAVAIFGVVLAGFVGFAVPAWAALQDTATLTGNTISIASGNGEPGEGNCTITNTGPGSTNTCVINESTTITCGSSNSVNVNTTTNQSATTGEATNTDNTNGGDATNGSTSNSSSISTTVTIDNNTCTQ